MTAAPVMSITDELVAELEAAALESLHGCPTWLERDGYSLSCVDASDVNHIVIASPAVIRALLAERAELKRDAERYRWLRDKAMETAGDCPVVMMLDDCLEPANGAKTSSALELDDLDAAIDAAMQAAK